MEGERLDDRFDIERRVGEGAMGVVYRARDRLTGDAVAVKMLLQGGGADERRFERESLILSQLGHPGVVRYVAHGKSRGRTYLAMEWLEGETLESRLLRGALDVAECLTLGVRIAEALAEAHRKGVVHRDLKPSNILLVGGAVADAKVLDFGIARWQLDARALTRTGRTIGTLLYMSPEQARGRADLDARSDIFSLGAVLYECLTHRPVFLGEDALAVLAKILREPAERVSTFCPDAPGDLVNLVARMLEKDAAARPQSAEEVRERLLSTRRELLESGALRVDPVMRPARPEAYQATGTHAELRVVSVVLVKANPVEKAMPLAVTEFHHLAMAGAQETREGSSLAAPLLGRLQAAVSVHGGLVEPLVDGSLVVSLSATPTPKEQAVRAARCALSLRGLLGDVPMTICTGHAMVQGRSAIGEVIERASRILAKSGDGGIHLDGATAALVDGRFHVDGGPQDSTLRGEREVASGRRMLLGKSTQYVGRERDLEILLGSFRDCVDESRARAVLVGGPAGQGKTRTLEEFLSRLSHAPVHPTVLLASADSLRTGSAFGTIGPALRAIAGADESSKDGPHERMRAFFGAHLATEMATRVSVFLGELAGVSFDDTVFPPLAAARQDPRLMADQMLLAWLDWLDAASGAGPVIIVLEDLHWADLPSVQFVGAALRRMKDKPLMVLGLARPEIHERFPGLWTEHGLLVMPLGGLSRKASERLLQEALGDRIDAAKRAWLAERADGNPFFLEELIRAVDAGKDQGEVPVTVLGMVHARLDALGDDAKHVVRAASVFGAEFPADGVRAVLGLPVSDQDVDQWLRILGEREIVYEKSRDGSRKTHGFRHALVREAAYTMLPEDDRAMCHRLAGQWLEGAGETQAIVIAEHFERGGARERAASWFRRAGAQAIEGDDLASAIAHGERGIACGAEGELLGELDWVIMEARSWRGQFAEAIDPGLEALRLLSYASDLWFQVSGQLVCAAVGSGDGPRADEVAHDMLAANAAHPCGAGGVMGLANGAYGLASMQPELGTDVATIDALIEATEDALRRLPPQPRAEVWLDVLRGARTLLDDDWAGATLHVEAAAAGFRRIGDMRGLLLALTNLGWYRQELGSLARAEASLAEAAELTERLDLSGPALDVRDNQSLVLFFQGRMAEAAPFLRTSIEARTRRRDPRVGILRYYLARVLLGKGSHEEAEQEGRRSAAELGPQSPYHACALATVACAMLEQNRIEEALGEARVAARMLEAGAVAREGQAMVRLALAEALHANGLVDEARVVIRAASECVAARAAAISDLALRESFCLHVPDNARTLAREREWCGV